jgi:hypothetical protein
VLVIGVAGLIGFRGFDSADVQAEKQTVKIERALDGREVGAAAKPAAAVIGSAKKPARAASATRPTAKRKAPRRARRAKAAERSGLSAPAKPRTAGQPAVGPAPAAEAPAAEPAATDKEAPAAAVPATPVDEVVEEVTGVVEKTTKPVESVGDVLLDVRDLLP